MKKCFKAEVRCLNCFARGPHKLLHTSSRVEHLT